MTTEADAVAKLARESAAATTIRTADGREFLIVPSGASQIDVSDEHGLKVDAPRYIKQAVTVQTADSLVDYVNGFKGEHTVLFADIALNTIVAQIDYHAPAQATH